MLPGGSIILSACTVLISTIAMAALAFRVLERVWPRDALSEPLRCAAFVILTFAAIYVQVMLTGAVGYFSWPVLAAVNLTSLAVLLVRGPGALTEAARLARQTVSLPFVDCRDLGGRAFVAWLLLMIVLEGAVPKSVGDDVGYHLPSIMNIVRSGATLQVVAGYGADVLSPTAYYLRGHEAILALFFQAPGAHLYTLLEALAVLNIVYLCLLEFSASARLARALTFFLCTGLMLGAPYKGDYLLAALALFVMTILIRRGGELGAAALPVLAALMLLLALKSSTLMFVAVASSATAWQLRSVWPPARIALALTSTAVLGLAFYLGNLVYQGNPLYPFRVAFAGRVLFDGPSALDVLPSSLLGNLGVSMVAPFARGLARVTSPLAVLALPALLALLFRYFKEPNDAASRRTAFVFLTLCTLSFVTTPFSDNNQGAPHSQLYSGHTLRMALPLVLLTLALASAVVAAWSERAATRAARLVTLLALGNLVFYDLAALLLKPANAFASYAPLLHTFDVRILAAGFAGLAGLALFTAHACRPLLALALALLAAALLRPCIAVSSFAYSPGFRNLGKRSRVVAELTALGDPSKSVSLLEDGATGPLRGIVTPVLLETFGRVTFARAVGDALGRDLIVLPTRVEETIEDLVHGRVYALHKPTRVLQTLTQAGYRALFEDELYTVLAKTGQP